MVRARSAFVLIMMATAACGGGNKKQPAKPVAKKQPAKKKAAKPVPALQVDASPNLGVDEDLVAKCQIRINNKTTAPKFNYDRFDLMTEDREVLDVVAGCVKDGGPLSGRNLVLVGHTDDAGTIEYNLALGSKRASTVADYLEKMGVPNKQIGVTTRGEIDAEGSSEDSRKTDRRVDVTLEREKDTVRDDDMPSEEVKTVPKS